MASARLPSSVTVTFSPGSAQPQIAACAKHFAGNNVEDTRMTNNAIMDEQTLREVYTRQFEMIVKEGREKAMSVFNAG